MDMTVECTHPYIHTYIQRYTTAAVAKYTHPHTRETERNRAFIRPGAHLETMAMEEPTQSMKSMSRSRSILRRRSRNRSISSSWQGALVERGAQIEREREWEERELQFRRGRRIRGPEKGREPRRTCPAGPTPPPRSSTSQHQWRSSTCSTMRMVLATRSSGSVTEAPGVVPATPGVPAHPWPLPHVSATSLVIRHDSSVTRFLGWGWGMDNKSKATRGGKDKENGMLERWGERDMGIPRSHLPVITGNHRSPILSLDPTISLALFLP